ncbi:hypothetical protein ACVWZB_002981 [Paenibacillus polymyxa]
MLEPKSITIMLRKYIVGYGVSTILTRIMPGIWPGSFYLETLNFRTTGDIRLKPHLDAVEQACFWHAFKRLCRLFFRSPVS